MKTKNRKFILSIACIFASITLIIFGLLNNGFKINWGKGAAICWECIGLGEN